MPTYTCKNLHKSTIQLPKCTACGEPLFEAIGQSETLQLSKIDSKFEKFQLNLKKTRFLSSKITAISIAIIISLFLISFGVVQFRDDNQKDTFVISQPNDQPSIQTLTAPSSSTSEASAKAKPVEPLMGPFTVIRVISADTYDLLDEGNNQIRVRLIGIDAPSENQEQTSQECGGSSALQQAAYEFGYSDKKVMLEADNSWPAQDSLGNFYYYIWIDGELFSESLIAQGHAIEYAKHGNYHHRQIHLAAQAKAQGSSNLSGALGIWKNCPSDDGVAFGIDSDADEWNLPIVPFIVGADEKNYDCHPSYIGTCLDPSYSDYNCGRSGEFYVIGPDVYRLDRDNDGVACEG